MMDDFDRAVIGAHLLVAMGMPLVSVIDAVVAWRRATTPGADAVRGGRVIGHELAHVTQEAHHVTAECECGASWDHPDREGAVKRHGGHVLIQQARQALKGDTK